MEVTHIYLYTYVYFITSSKTHVYNLFLVRHIYIYIYSIISHECLLLKPDLHLRSTLLHNTFSDNCCFFACFFFISFLVSPLLLIFCSCRKLLLYLIILRHKTLCRNPLNGWSARHRDNTQHPQVTNIHAPGGIRSHNPSRRASAQLCLRPRGHRHRIMRIITLYSF